MNRWLADECKWAREQALKCRNEAADLASPGWREQRLRRIAADKGALYAAIDRHLRLVSEESLLTDDEALAERIERLTRDAEHWEQIATEQSARLEHTESEPLFADP